MHKLNHLVVARPDARRLTDGGRLVLALIAGCGAPPIAQTPSLVAPSLPASSASAAPSAAEAEAEVAPSRFRALLLTPARAFESYARSEDTRIHFQPDDALFLFMSGGTVRISADSTTPAFFPAARPHGRITWSDNGARFLAQTFASNATSRVTMYSTSKIFELPRALPHSDNAILSADGATLAFTVGDDDELPTACSWHIEIWNAVAVQAKSRICLDATNVGKKGPTLAGLSLAADGRWVGVQGSEYTAVISTETGKTVMRSAPIPMPVDSGVFAAFVGARAILAERNQLSIFETASKQVRHLPLNCALGRGMWTHQTGTDPDTLVLNCGVGVMALNLKSGKHRSIRADVDGTFHFCAGERLCKTADDGELFIVEPNATKFHKPSVLELQNQLLGLSLASPINFDDPALGLDAGERIVLKEADASTIQLSPHGQRVVLYRNGAVHVLALPSFTPLVRLGDLWPVANTHNRGIDFNAHVAIEDANLALYPDGPEGPVFRIAIGTLMGNEAAAQTADTHPTPLYQGTTGRMTEEERSHTLGMPILTSRVRPNTGWYTRGFEVPQTLHYVENGIESDTEALIFGKGYIAFARNGRVELFGDKKSAEQVVLCTDGLKLAPANQCVP